MYQIIRSLIDNLRLMTLNKCNVYNTHEQIRSNNSTTMSTYKTAHVQCIELLKIIFNKKHVFHFFKTFKYSFIVFYKILCIK